MIEKKLMYFRNKSLIFFGKTSRAFVKLKVYIFNLIIAYLVIVKLQAKKETITSEYVKNIFLLLCVNQEINSSS